MKKFVIKGAVFLFLFQLPFLFEGLLPVENFCRSIAQKRYTSVYGNAFPNTKLKVIEWSNMVDPKDNPETKLIINNSDNLGFRNNNLIKSPDIVLIGDSQIACYNVTQDSILSEQIMNQTNLKVYNVSIGSPEVFAQLLSDSLIEKPELIVFENIEREIPKFRYRINPRKGKTAALMKFIGTDKRMQILTDFVSKYTKNSLTKRLKSKVFPKINYPKSPIDSTFYFYDGTKSEIQLSEKEMESLVGEFIKVKTYFEALGIEVAYMPFPNKETIYWEKVPYQNQPDFIQKFTTELKNKGLNVIPTLDSLNKNRNKELLYFKDDTHWNTNGIKLVSELIINHYITIKN